MRSLIATLLGGALLVACGSANLSKAGDNSDPAEEPMPTNVTFPPGPVTGQGMVLETPTGPIFCLGPVAESYPPQCDGPALVNWRWKPVSKYLEGDQVRFGTFALTGTFDGDAFALTEPAVPLALYDPVAAEPDQRPCVEPDTDPEKISSVLRELPGYLSDAGSSLTDPCVGVSVLYDDGTLQGWADDTYGTGAVRINSALGRASS
jgi:hypothetical protein